MKKTIITVLIVAGVVILGSVLYKKYKKPCPCSQTPENAINGMTEAELKDQIIKMGSKVRLEGKTIDELKSILLQLTTAQ